MTIKDDFQNTVKQILLDIGLVFVKGPAPTENWAWNVQIYDDILSWWIKARKTNQWRIDTCWYGATKFGFQQDPYYKSRLFVWYINPKNKELMEILENAP